MLQRGGSGHRREHTAIVMRGTAPSIHSLSPEQRREAYDAASDRAMDAVRDMAAERKARKPDPRAEHYLTWKDQGRVCVLVVKHRKCMNSYEVSRDGVILRDQHIFLPDSKTIVLEESTGDFLLALFPRSFVRWLETKDGGKDWTAAQRFKETFGVTLPLNRARPWTPQQIATWKRLESLRSSINYRIQTARLPDFKRRTLTLTRNDAS